MNKGIEKRILDTTKTESMKKEMKETIIKTTDRIQEVTLEKMRSMIDMESLT